MERERSCRSNADSSSGLTCNQASLIFFVAAGRYLPPRQKMLRTPDRRLAAPIILGISVTCS